jgi:glycosyltransferase involved in cell wall biosynthesis
MSERLYYLGRPEDGFGWGVANTNITRALAEFCEVIIDTSNRKDFDAPVFMPIVDQQLTPARKVNAPRLIGYCFTEWPIGDKAQLNARQYDHIFAGSTWNSQRLAEHGIRAEVLHQGIDFERFKVQPWTPFETRNPSTINHQPSTKFVVFSGGKFEFRKGQDIVCAAMRLFLRQHPDAVLLAAWHNPWPQSKASMISSWLLKDWRDPLLDLPCERVIEIPPLRNDQTPELYAQAHIGVFPNRCEAGTNLVMCEFMASGRPVIATAATGHADVFEKAKGERRKAEVGTCTSEPLAFSLQPSAFLLTNGTYDPAGWFNCNVSDVLACLEHAYQHRDELETRGLECRKLIERFTWRACAEKIFQAAFPAFQISGPAGRVAIATSTVRG